MGRAIALLCGCFGHDDDFEAVKLQQIAMTTSLVRTAAIDIVD